MTESKADMKLKRITIKTETGSKWFDDAQKLQQWVNLQRSLYSKSVNLGNNFGLNRLTNEFDQTWQQLQNSVNNGLMRNQGNPETYNTQAEQWSSSFNQAIANNKIFTEEAPFYNFYENQSAIKVEYGIALLGVKFSVNLSNMTSDLLEGIFQAKDYFNGNSINVSDEDENLSDLKRRWDKEFSEQRDTWISEYSIKVDESTSHNQKVSGLIEQWEKQTETQTADLESHKNEFKSKFDNELQHAKSDLENLTKTYDDNLALHASVRYWKMQLDSHNKKAVYFAIALGIVTLIVIGAIISFSYLTLDAPLKEIHLSKIFTAAALTTFGIWLIKILANIFMSHLHLATDAQERRTMIHTYLALTRKGQGPKEEDRQLILQTLFRPSSTNMVKNDQGPTQLVDMINRLSPKTN